MFATEAGSLITLATQWRNFIPGVVYTNSYKEKKLLVLLHLFWWTMTVFTREICVLHACLIWSVPKLAMWQHCMPSHIMSWQAHGARGYSSHLRHYVMASSWCSGLLKSLASLCHGKLMVLGVTQVTCYRAPSIASKPGKYENYKFSQHSND